MENVETDSYGIKHYYKNGDRIQLRLNKNEKSKNNYQ